ncbi:hypothetical protein BDN71DRAFT_1287035 [Pleurotus eryngii]|uniref:Uncharacterized protein n=1 Tax=Pleurotus eryngii TaxID=5323 RepID=A0A9P5ZRB0_PLEER|nr:hypothetical protein BDN71DRAFT_1287035 [Pleurotus eryngii]
MAKSAEWRRHVLSTAGILTLSRCRFRLPWLVANVVNLAVYDSEQRLLRSIYQQVPQPFERSGNKPLVNVVLDLSSGVKQQPESCYCNFYNPAFAHLLGLSMNPADLSISVVRRRASFQDPKEVMRPWGARKPNGAVQQKVPRHSGTVHPGVLPNNPLEKIGDCERGLEEYCRPATT